MSTTKKKPKRKYWVRFYLDECPLCGKERGYQERVYDEPKPKDPQDRYVTLPTSWCAEHFL